jgi:hypothetical protein
MDAKDVGSPALVYDTDKAVWNHVKSTAYVRRHAACIALSDGRIFMIGGLVEFNHTMVPSASSLKIHSFCLI